jgi:hypothetical protein
LGSGKNTKASVRIIHLYKLKTGKLFGRGEYIKTSVIKTALDLI